MKKKFLLLLLLSLLFIPSLTAGKQPKNVIFLIGDGMGLAQIYLGMVENGNTLELERMKHIGLSKTYSADNFVTDSGAGGTALATGVKTKNHMIGMGPDSVAVETILEQAERNGLSTGIVVSCALTYVTPATFIAHQVNRKMYEECAADYLKTDIDVFIGGGRKYFDSRSDGRSLIDELKAKNYQVATTLDEVVKVKSGKLAGLVHEDQLPEASERGNYLSEATMAAIDILDNNKKKGFFLMVEGSQIDWAGHSNDAAMMAREMIDFDKTIGAVLDYAQKDGNTLVVVTADHETGGLSLLGGSIVNKKVKTNFSSKGHSGIPVPVFAFGPGAEEFMGFMENTDFKNKISKLLKLKK
jgi:alkaline phosphatase